MTRYSDEFKYSIIKRMMPPNNESASAISRETGLPEGTLYTWKKQARANGIAVPGGEPEAERWSTQDKFLIVVETASLSEIEMAEYCRKKGLFAEQVQACQSRGCVIAEKTVDNYMKKTLKPFG